MIPSQYKNDFTNGNMIIDVYYESQGRKNRQPKDDTCYNFTRS